MSIAADDPRRLAAISYRRTLMNLIERIERDWLLGRYDPDNNPSVDTTLPVLGDLSIESVATDGVSIDTGQQKAYNEKT